MRIAVVGAQGQLGAAVAYACAPAHEVIPFTHAELDATDDAAVAAAMGRVGPDAIVNGAAYTDVDASEDHPVDALNVNAFAVRALARAARQIGATLVHYSTDFVFDGQTSEPYREDEPLNPRGVYAASKMLGEWFAADAPRAYILRVESLFGRAPGAAAPKGSVAGIMNALLAGGAPRVFEDRMISPTYVIDAAHATRRMLELGPPGGVYHCVNSGSCTWLEFGHELARQLGVAPRLVPTRMADVPMRAARPLFSALANDKLRSAGIDMPPWQDALARYLQSERLHA